MNKVKILYITGWGRSGTTILDRILGQIDGFNSVGEIRYIWDRNFIEDHLCGCGRRFTECPEWQAIVKDAFGSFDAVNAERMIRMRNRLTRTRHMLALAWPGLVRRAMGERSKDYLAALVALYRSIQKHFGSRVIVDSSKFPTYAFVLDILPEIELHVVHIVRDPRAVAFSWLRKKMQPDSGELKPMDEHGPVFSSLLWTSWNVATEMIWARRGKKNYTFVRYEDFILRPKATVEHILHNIGETADGLPFIDDHKVMLGPNHTCSGNPNRFTEGVIDLKLDNEWESRIRRRDRYIVTSLTLPLLGRYGYKI